MVVKENQVEGESRGLLHAREVRDPRLRHTRPHRADQEHKSKEEVIEEKVVDTRPKPKTIFGKFWRWLNSY